MDHRQRTVPASTTHHQGTEGVTLVIANTKRGNMDVWEAAPWKPRGKLVAVEKVYVSSSCQHLPAAVSTCSLRVVPGLMSSMTSLHRFYSSLSLFSFLLFLFLLLHLTLLVPFLHISSSSRSVGCFGPFSRLELILSRFDCSPWSCESRNSLFFFFFRFLARSLAIILCYLPRFLGRIRGLISFVTIQLCGILDTGQRPKID